MDKLEVSLPGPIFYSRGDEDRFFTCFYNLPEYVAVTGRLKNLTLELNLPLCRESFEELIALLARYNISLSCLRPALAALSEDDKSSFKRPEAFWHNDLFGP